MVSDKHDFTNSGHSGSDSLGCGLCMNPSRRIGTDAARRLISYILISISKSRKTLFMCIEMQGFHVDLVT